jgi:hypothetical protein
MKQNRYMIAITGRIAQSIFFLTCDSSSESSGVKGCPYLGLASVMITGRKSPHVPFLLVCCNGAALSDAVDVLRLRFDYTLVGPSSGNIFRVHDSTEKQDKNEKVKV